MMCDGNWEVEDNGELLVQCLLFRGEGWGGDGALEAGTTRTWLCLIRVDMSLFTTIRLKRNFP